MAELSDLNAVYNQRLQMLIPAYFTWKKKGY